MLFEKSKVLKAAEKFLSQGKISAAIKEYRQVIHHDDHDLTTLNMLGDLLARAGEKEEAISCFSRIAEHYREQQFTLKAIAMYRKIDKLKPRDPETAIKLAALYATQGLVVDARAQYLVVADACTKAGETRKTLHVLHKIADLDPHNTEIRLKLAEGYLLEGMKADAVKAFCEAADHMLDSGLFEKSLAAYTRALELQPNDILPLKGLVAAHVAMGTADEAAELLEKAVAETPDDAELVSMLAQSYIDAEDPVGAERAISSLMAQDASNYRRLIEVARAYLKQDQEDEAARIVGSVIEPMLSGREENDLLELVNELLDRNPEHVPSLRLLARVHWWQRDMEKLRAALERLAESAELLGLVEDERYALTQLHRLAPDEQRYLERLNSIGGVLEEAMEEPPMAPEPASGDVPSFESFAIVGEDMEEGSDGEVAETAPSAEFQWNSVSEQKVSDPRSSFADLNETDISSKLESDVKVMREPATPDSSYQEFVFGGEGVADTSKRKEPAPAASNAANVQSMMQQELESVDFYITQGYSDIAGDTLDLLERQFGSHPEIDSRRAKLTGVPAAKPPEDFGLASDIVFDEPIAARRDHSEPARVGSGIDSGLAEIFEEFRVEAEGEHASSKEDYETHYNMAIAYKEMDLLDEAIREFQTAAGLTGSADGTSRYLQCCNMLGHCFLQKGIPRAAVLWFKKGLEAPGRTAEEYKALQYELGSAYEQMGDVTRAIEVFTEVYGVDVGYRDIATKLPELQERKAATHKKKKKGK
ncbi:MAG: tetratricopeptide repeat protein [Acidobacteriota bacterium]|nr:tetratricopeptide repeat protein [Acidobacteriota bacterium]